MIPRLDVPLAKRMKPDVRLAQLGGAGTMMTSRASLTRIDAMLNVALAHE